MIKFVCLLGTDVRIDPAVVGVTPTNDTYTVTVTAVADDDVEGEETVTISPNASNIQNIQFDSFQIVIEDRTGEYVLLIFLHTHSM